MRASAPNCLVPACPTQVWECEMDYDAFRESKELNPYDIPRNKDGSVVTWCFGKYQNARARITLA